MFGVDVTAVWVWNDQNDELPGFTLSGDPSMATYIFELYDAGDGKYAMRTTPQKPVNR